MRAVFLDRDGVLLKDVDLLTSINQVHFFESSFDALRSLQEAGFVFVVVSNQPVIARGLVTESQVQEIHRWIQQELRNQGISIDHFYYCPHHPRATLPNYRIVCDCRKPRPGMLLRASKEWGIDLGPSWMIGDRISDIVAGKRAGCHTILVETGMHLAPPIESMDSADLTVTPDHVCSTLAEAAKVIMANET